MLFIKEKSWPFLRQVTALKCRNSCTLQDAKVGTRAELTMENLLIRLL